MKIDDETREKLRRVAAGLFGASIGCIIGQIMIVRAEKRMKNEHEKLQNRWKFLVYTAGQMIDIENDVTMSGSERMAKVQELQEFLELVVEQELT